jgi:hypothetical protein
MQLGYGLLPNFFYTASHSNGIHLEVLDEDTTRIWLIEISGSNGIVKQIMGDFTVAGFEKAQDLDVGGIPPEIEEVGWFDIQTTFDTSRPVYTKADWDALPEDEQPGIKTVTFQMLPTSDYLAVVDDYRAHGDYGWSFNPAGTSAVLCGLQWNYPAGGGLAVNYKSQIFTVTLNHTAYTATLVGGGKNAFLMGSSKHSVKWPDDLGLIWTAYYWKGQNGFHGTQPSSSYTAPIYTYYDLAGQQVTCEFQYNAGDVDDPNPGGGGWGGWEEVLACREATVWGLQYDPPAQYHYGFCSTAKQGAGTYGSAQGFVTTIATPDSYDTFDGSKITFSSPATVCEGDLFIEMVGKAIQFGIPSHPRARRAAGHADTQYAALESGNFFSSIDSVLIIPGFERLGFYHYKKIRNYVSDGLLSHPYAHTLERGTPTREHGDSSIPQKGCEQQATSCSDTFGYSGERRPDRDTKTQYHYTRQGMSNQVEPVYTACSDTQQADCFFGQWEPVVHTVPANQDPYNKDETLVVGGLMLPDGGMVMFSDDEINNLSQPFRESSEDFGVQSVISCFDTFSSKYIYSMPDIALTPTKHTADGFPDDFVRRGVLFSGMPYFTE